MLSSAPNFTAGEADSESENFLLTIVYHSCFPVETVGDIDEAYIDDGMVSAFGEHIDDHSKCQRIFKDRFFAVYVSHTADTVAHNNR